MTSQCKQVSLLGTGFREPWATHGDITPALKTPWAVYGRLWAILGEGSPLLAASVTWPEAEWQQEYEAWRRRKLDSHRYLHLFQYTRALYPESDGFSLGLTADRHSLPGQHRFQLRAPASERHKQERLSRDSNSRLGQG